MFLMSAIYPIRKKKDNVIVNYQTGQLEMFLKLLKPVVRLFINGT